MSALPALPDPTPALPHHVPEMPEAFAAPVSPARAARVLLWSIAGFSLTMIGWAGLAELDETAVAVGRVVPAQQLQVVSNLEGGTVAAILVRPGQRVAAGDVLLRLDAGLASADFGRMRAGAEALAARIARLEGEVAGRAPLFPPALAATEAVAAEAALYAARQSDLASAGAGDSARLEGALRLLAEAEAQRRASGEARAQAAREVAMIAPLVEKGIEPAIGLDRARSALAQAAAGEAAAGEAVRRAGAGVAEARAGGRGAAGRFRSQAGDALAAARAELAAQSATLPALRSRMTRTELRAPVDGIVQRVLAGTIGGSVAPGAPLVEVVPAGGSLVVEAQVRPSDIAFVHQGQRATVKLTAYDSSVYGGLEGRVDRISPDAVVDERSGTSWYLVRVVTTASALVAPDGMKLPLGAGMVAEVDLVGRKRSVLSYLLAPVTKLRRNAFREH